MRVCILLQHASLSHAHDALNWICGTYLYVIVYFMTQQCVMSWWCHYTGPSLCRIVIIWKSHTIVNLNLSTTTNCYTVQTLVHWCGVVELCDSWYVRNLCNTLVSYISSAVLIAKILSLVEKNTWQIFANYNYISFTAELIGSYTVDHDLITLDGEYHDQCSWR